jgi:hypothetical protein
MRASFYAAQAKMTLSFMPWHAPNRMIAALAVDQTATALRATGGILVYA